MGGEQAPQFEPIIDESGMATGLYQEVGVPGSSFSIQELQDAGFMDNAGNLVTQASSSGRRFSGLFGPDSFADKILNIDPNKGTGPLSFLTGGGDSKGIFGGEYGRSSSSWIAG